MALNNYQDITLAFNANSGINLDVSGWNSIVVHAVTLAGTATFNTTNDGGGITGTRLDSAPNATNWGLCQGVNVATGASITTGTGSNVYKFTNFGRFFQITGTTAAKLLIMYSKNL